MRDIPARVRDCFSALQYQFNRASSDWPNYESVLITWPENEHPPAGWPQWLDAQYGVPCGDDKTLAWTVLHGERRDTPAHRYRANRAGALIDRRSFGVFGDPRIIRDSDDAMACIERWKLLSAQAVELMAEVDPAFGNGWHGQTGWRVYLHNVSGVAKQRHENATVEVIRDVFLASCFAIAKLLNNHDPADLLDRKAIAKLCGRTTDWVRSPKIKAELGRPDVAKKGQGKCHRWRRDNPHLVAFLKKFAPPQAVRGVAGNK